MTSRTSRASDKKIARLVLRHLRMEQGRKVRGMQEVYESDAVLFNAITHVLGYRLGERLYYGLVSGFLSKKEIRDLFFERFDGEGAALTSYLYLIVRTRGVKTPERM